VKLYLVTREDLSQKQQAVQTAHALREFVEHYPKEDREWYEKSNTLVLLATRDEATLKELLEKARAKRVPVAPFHEPDRNHELTAIALGPKGKALCRRLPLALGEEVRRAIDAHEPSSKVPKTLKTLQALRLPRRRHGPLVSEARGQETSTTREEGHPP
jgi:peptidyl-tRNA hydrolase